MEKFKQITVLAGVLLLGFTAYASPPKVIKAVPDDGQRDVDPFLKQILIEFDQDMSSDGYSICGGGAKYPKTTGKPRWLSKRTLVLSVKLQPNHEYEMSVNCPSYRSCRSVTGEPAEIYPINFRTTAAGKGANRSSKPPSLLLQEGLHAEETEGDLDKAMEIYNQIREEYSEVERVSAQATYHLGMCYLKKGEKEKALQYFQEAVDYFPEQKTVVQQSQEQIDKIRPDVRKSVFAQIDGQVIRFISEQYGKTAAEAGEKQLYTNSHIYYVDPNFELYNGGMNFYYNNTGRTIAVGEKVRLSGTSYPNQTLYDTEGRALPTEILPDEERRNFYQVYWIADKPLAPGESLYYGWSMDKTRKLQRDQNEAYSLTMQNQFGSPVIETFFLVLPKNLKISQSAAPTASEKLLNFGIYWWTKEVQHGENHMVTLELTKSAVAETVSAKPLKLEAVPWVDGEVMEVRLKHPAGKEYGTIIYSAQSGENKWQIISHMYVSEGSVSQYTFVEAEANSFAPVYGQTTNWMGNFAAKYSNGNVKLTVTADGKESTKDIPISGTAYDNEQALYLIRRMPLAENYEGSFPIFSVQGGDTEECRIKVLGVEEVAVEAGTFKCYKTDLTVYSENVKMLQHTLWFSADEHKYLVKYDVGGSATMELAKVWQKSKGEGLTFKNNKQAFTVTVPVDWRFYNYSSGVQSSLQLIPPEVKAWAVLVWQKRGTDPDFASAKTIAKADCGKLKGFFENYTVDESSWKELKISSLEAAQYIANYQESGNALQKYSKPKDMVEYRTYIVDEANIYWFVFRIEKDKFEENKVEFDSIVNSFSAYAK